MNFVSGLPRSKKGNMFLPMKINNYMDKLARMYVNEVVRLHGVLMFIVSNKDP